MRNRGLKGAAMTLIFLAVFAGAAALVMLLWNALIPGIIGWSVIGFWQAAGLMLLVKILFGGFSTMHRGAHAMGLPRMSGMRRQMAGHMHRMSHEERREYIRKHMGGFGHGFCGHDHHHDHTDHHAHGDENPGGKPE